MKRDFGRKIVLLIHWLMSLVLGGAMVALFFMNVLPVKAHGVMVIAFAITALIVYLIFALGALLCIFPELNRWRRRNFVTITASGLGSTRISLAAVNQVINQATRGTPGIADQKIDIINHDDNIEINIDLTVDDDANIPMVTSTIQTAVRKHVESKCGVEVKNVVVSVHSIKEDEPEVVAKTDDGKQADTATQDAAESVDMAEDGAEVKPEAAVQEPVNVDAVEPEDEYAGLGAETSGDEEWLEGLEEEPPEFEENESADAEAPVYGDEEVGDEAAAEEPPKTEGTSGSAPGQGTSRSAKRRRRRKKKLMARMQAEKEAASVQSAGAESTELSADDADIASEDDGDDFGVADTESGEAEEGYAVTDTVTEDAEEGFWAAETQSGDGEDNFNASDFDAEPEAEDTEAEDATETAADAGEEELDAFAETPYGEAEYEDERIYSETDDNAQADDIPEGDTYAEEAEVTEYDTYDSDLSDVSDYDTARGYGSEEEYPDAGYEDATLRLDDDETPAYYEDDDTRLTDEDDTTY